MTQKIVEVVGTSKESFAKATENAVAEAAKTVRGLKWAGGGIRDAIGRKERGSIPRHNEDLLRRRTPDQPIDFRLPPSRSIQHERVTAK
jgi:flavin-binding protein dodecin